MNHNTFALLLVAFACLHDTMGFTPLPPTASSLSSTLQESRQLQLHAQWSPNKELFSKSMFSFQQQPLWYDNHNPTARSIVYHDDVEDAFSFAPVGSDWELADPNEQSPRVALVNSRRPLWRRLLSLRRQ